MKLGLMQPYFFPYLGYFSVIKNTNKWVILDTVQYIKQGWVNRNRVLNPNGGWQYIIVPVKKHPYNTRISDIQICPGDKWKTKIIRQLEHYKKNAPFYSDVIKVPKEVLQYDTDNICDLNIFSLKKVCEYLNIRFNYKVISELNITLGEIKEPDDWALEISKALKVKAYINPPGGKDFFQKKKFDSAGIELKFLKVNLAEYNQKRDKFEPGLSIIDVMMFNSKQEIQKMLNDYEYI